MERSSTVKKNTAKTQKTPPQGETAGKRSPSASGRTPERREPEAGDDEDFDDEDEVDEEDDDR